MKLVSVCATAIVGPASFVGGWVVTGWLMRKRYER